MKWVTRKDLSGRDVSARLLCVESRPLIEDSGLVAIGDQVAALLKQGERLGEGAPLNPVLMQGKVVAYIEIAEPGY